MHVEGSDAASALRTWLRGSAALLRPDRVVLAGRAAHVSNDLTTSARSWAPLLTLP
ncbi:hypothetical protein [Streptomyces sp. MJM1172]|uniref:hypothetical protein n=1 Tax=Streptomyces sp. MJM1172 TaxID=1703926 RepID=UPI001A7E1058|nr:hypothetical protein [Streptomyces sp. MJM1172]